MQNKIELYLLGLALVLIDTLILLNDFHYKIILVFILNIIFFSLIYLNVKRQRDQRSVIKQANEIIDGNLNKRIYIKNDSYTADFAQILNELSEKLQKQKIKNIESEKTRKRFLSNISHDIRTPLTSLLGYVEVLNENKDIGDKEKQRYYEILIRKAKNLKDMIDDIFQMARIESNNYDYDFKEIDLAEILRQTILDYLPDIKKEEIPIIFKRNYKGKDFVKNSYLNSGFGLAIADKLVQLHNGYIDVNSQPNSKTVFTIFFPAVN